jgi:hypothetical protein
MDKWQDLRCRAELIPPCRHDKELGFKSSADKYIQRSGRSALGVGICGLIFSLEICRQRTVRTLTIPNTVLL